MILLKRGLFFVAFFAFGGLTAWRIIATSMADRYAWNTPERALEWDPHNPAALLAIARHQLTEHDPTAATVTARELLRVEPLEGQAFTVLAEAAEAGGETDKVRALHEIALRRAPRDLRARAWIIDAQLREGRYAEALAQSGLQTVVSLIGAGARAGDLRNLSAQRRVARQIGSLDDCPVDDQILKVWHGHHQVSAVLSHVSNC